MSGGFNGFPGSGVPWWTLPLLFVVLVVMYIVIPGLIIWGLVEVFG